MQAVQFALLSSLLPLLVSGQEDSGYDVPAGGAGSTESANEAGASGDDTGSFTLSSGALIAIIIVVVVVVLLGGGSLALWYIAKKRQWEVRASIKRASRRLTGRGDTRSKRQTRRSAVRLASPPRKNRDADLEKGNFNAKPNQPRTTTTITSTFEVDTPVAKSWKQKLTGWTPSPRT